jgi:hypothetical protein
MKRFYPSLAVAALMVLGGSAFVAPASAAPPTVTPSPGYDARLQEHRPFMNRGCAIRSRFSGTA